MSLSIPDITPDDDTIKAALAYAEAGWYVLPLEPATKRPAKFMGNGWQHQSSRDPMEIASWFAGTDYALGLHVGRSGAVVVDMDDYTAWPTDLRESLAGAPFQNTRDNDAARGHYVFEVPAGRTLGNGRGTLPRAFGEIRGLNGIIAVSPSTHQKEHGRYEWRSTGPVPVLPEPINAMLPDGQRAEDSANDETVKAFLEQHTGASAPHLLKPVLEKFGVGINNGESRHEALVTALVWAMREARAGLYPARTAMDALWQDFSAFMGGERFPRSEFRGVMAWAVSQALATDPARRAEEVQARLAERDARAAAAVSTAAPDSLAADDFHAPRPAGDYFGKDGIDVELAATDVLSLGPLAWGGDGAFWSYSDGVWRPDEDAVEARVVKLLGSRFRGAHATNVATVVRHSVGKIDCDPHPDYMNFTNGMLDWRTGELLPHAAHYGSTVQFPLAWEPDATCPDFERFLSQVLSPDYVDLAWEMLGYMLFSGNPLQKAFLFFGAGRNGKGTLMRVILEMLGAPNVSAVSLDALNSNRFASAALFGRIANLAGDIDATFQQETAKFKQLTGGDLMDAEEKHRKAFRFTSWAVPVFSANKIPGSADTSFGYLRRWVVIHFTREITDEEVDPDLDAKLAAELPGIAVKAVAALRVLMERRNFENKGEVAQGHAEFAETIDQVRQWLIACTIPSPGHAELARACYENYRSWADDEGNRALRSSEFYARLENAGYPKRKSGTFVIRDIRLGPVAPRRVGNEIPLGTEPAPEEDR